MPCADKYAEAMDPRIGRHWIGPSVDQEQERDGQVSDSGSGVAKGKKGPTDVGWLPLDPDRVWLGEEGDGEWCGTTWRVGKMVEQVAAGR